MWSFRRYTYLLCLIDFVNNKSTKNLLFKKYSNTLTFYCKMLKVAFCVSNIYTSLADSLTVIYSGKRVTTGKILSFDNTRDLPNKLATAAITGKIISSNMLRAVLDQK